MGAISTLTGPIASDFDGLAPGIQAYFDTVERPGGINGRKLILAYNLDDGGQPSQFTQLTHTLIDQDHAFAVMVASYLFTPELLRRDQDAHLRLQRDRQLGAPPTSSPPAARSSTTRPVCRPTPT